MSNRVITFVFLPHSQYSGHNWVTALGLQLAAATDTSELTFHNVDNAAHGALLDDEAAGHVLNRVHAVHNLADLRHLQVFHEVVVQNGAFNQVPRPATVEK